MAGDAEDRSHRRSGAGWFGWRYGRIESVGREATLPLPHSLGAAGEIQVADLLP